MWFNRPEILPEWKIAERHLRSVDPVMGRIIDRVGPCTLHPRKDYFIALCQAIFTQQVSTAVATVLFERFRGHFPRRRPTPSGVVSLSDEAMQASGLSRQKRTYLRDLAKAFVEKRVCTRRFGRMSDEEIVQALLPIKGIGRWTAEMFLIFVLNRPDVLPVDDLGVRKGAQVAYGLAELPDADQLTRLAEVWRPWRTVGTWYLWRGGAAG